MIVVDTNIICYFFLPTKYSDSVDILYKKDPIWVAPLLWKSEFRNVLALYLRKKILSFTEILLVQEKAELLMMEGEYTIPSSRVLSAVNASACSAYDCEFTALAQQFKISLVTQDKKILKEYPQIAKSIDQMIEHN